jgi:predicted  nucleic acid-binding Zn-ribbon protein
MIPVRSERPMGEGRKGSIPKMKTGTFLEMQMLASKKDFLERQLSDMARRKKQIDKKLMVIRRSMLSIEKSINAETQKAKRAGSPHKRYGVELAVVTY